MPRTKGWVLPAVFTAAATIAAASPTVAADPDDGKVTSTRQISEDGSQAKAAVAAARTHDERTKVDDRQKLSVTDALADSTGATHVRMRRTFEGLRVVGGDLVVHRSADGTFDGATQTLDREIAVDTEPTVTESKAVQRADASKDVVPKLVVDALGSTPKLAWLVTTPGRQKDGTPSRLDTYVDAKSGAVLRTEERIQTVDGDGDSLYGGTVPLRLTQSGSTYQLKDPTRGNTYTTDMKNTTDSPLCEILGIGCKTGTLFTSPDTHFGTGSNTNRESAAVDAQYGTNTTWDYYKGTFGRNGIFGTGAGSYNRVHYGTNYVNAFWDGTRMTYGDGNGTSYGPLTSLDVAGHEMTHGVTENTAGLTYSGESGGLNEATSDIFGSMVEFPPRTGRTRATTSSARSSTSPRTRACGGWTTRRRTADSLSCWSANGQGTVGRPLLIGHREPLLLPALRGVGHEVDRWCPAQLDDVQRLVGDRHRPRRRGEHLVPSPDGLHDVRDELRRSADRHPQRRAGPLRRRQLAGERRGRRLERGQRRLIRSPRALC